MEITCIGFLVFFSCSLPERAPANNYCQVAKPIYMARGDTRKTKEAVDTHNRIWKRLCAK